MHSELIRMQAINKMITYNIPTLTAIFTTCISDTIHYNNPSSILFVPICNNTTILGSVYLQFS